jgi:hypothetical protein
MLSVTRIVAVGLAAAAPFGCGLFDYADDCTKTATCPPTTCDGKCMPDAGHDAGHDAGEDAGLGGAGGGS